MSSRNGVASAVAVLALLCLAFVVTAGAQTPTVAPTATCPPPASPGPDSAVAPTGPLDPAPEQIVACIGSQSITGVTFQHWSDIARSSEGPSKHRRVKESEVLKQVMGFLISSDWIIGEARDRNIVVSEAKVHHTFDRDRAQQFPKRGAFRKFLRQSGQTVADILLRVRLSILSARIQSAVLAGDHGKRSREHALERFVQEFKLKWMEQTYCEPEYAVPDCGHVQASL
jgi:hypothetical protein